MHLSLLTQIYRLATEHSSPRAEDFRRPMYPPALWRTNESLLAGLTNICVHNPIRLPAHRLAIPSLKSPIGHLMCLPAHEPIKNLCLCTADFWLANVLTFTHDDQAISWVRCSVTLRKTARKKKKSSILPRGLRFHYNNTTLSLLSF